MEATSLSLKRLDAATRPLHATTDERWLDLLRPKTEIPDYLALLETTYGFIAPYDAALASLKSLPVRPQMRTTLLVRDLLALGRTSREIATLPMCFEVDLGFGEAALGWIYMVERAALIHADLLRHLRHRLPIDDASAFLGSGVDASHWSTLASTLECVESIEDVVCGARDAFGTLRDWFDQTGRSATATATVRS